MLRLSIIIPLERNSSLLEESLVSVLENRPSDCEVLVVLDEPYDDPYDLEDEVRFVPAHGANRAAALNAGLRAARGEFVHFLRCGVEATAGWADAALAAFRDPAVAAVAPAVHHRQNPEQLLTQGLIVTRGVRRIVSSARGNAVVGPTLTGGFYRRAVLNQLDGLAENLGAYADADLLLRLSETGKTTHAASQSILLARQEKRPRGFKHGLHSQRLFHKFAAKSGWFARLSHPFHVISDACGHWPGVIAAIGCLLGRTWACLEKLRSQRDSSPAPASEARPDTTNSPLDELASAVSGRQRIDAAHAELRRDESRREREAKSSVANPEKSWELR